MKVQVYIQGQRLDLHDDEGINVKQVIQDVKDISKIFGDFSQTFNVPASRRNNEIFKFYYNADINQGFDARLRVAGSIDVNTLDFKLGKFRLDGVNIKDNQPTDYKITFFGNAIKIKDLLGDDKLLELDWLDNFSHLYDGDVVKTGLTTGIDFTVDSVSYPKAVCYPLISYKRQYYYNSDASDDVGTEQLANIHYQSGHSNGVDSKELKPAIKLHLIIKAIQEKYGINFTSPFFDDVKFSDIYMNLNNSVESLSNGSLVYESLSGTASVNNGISYDYYTTVTPVDNTIPYRIKLTLNGDTVYESQNTLTGQQTRGNSFGADYTDAYEVTAEVITEESFAFSATTNLRVFRPIQTVDVFANTYNSQAVVLNANIPELLPDMKVFEFLTNIFKTFNLTVEADGEDLYVQDLQSWYSEGEIYDITPYVDLKKEKITRGKIYRQIDFKFKRSEQILAEQYRLSNLQEYGNLEFKLTDADGNDLEAVDGEVLKIESVFENPIHERLFDINDSSEITIQYCPYFNRQIEPITTNPFIFYAPLTNVSNNSIGYLNDGVYEELNDTILMPSHSYVIDDNSFNLNFNAEINEYTSIVMQDTIYKRYYDDYITDIFSIRRRNYKNEAILPDYFLQKLKLNDRVIIKDRRFIINSIESNLTDRKDKLELINDIYDAPLQSDTLNTSLFRTASGLYNYFANTYSISYIGLSGKTVQAFDLGDGSTFLNILTKTTLSNVFTVTFSLSTNSGEVSRGVGIQVIDGLNDPIYTVYQKNDGVRFDNTTITFDSDITTWDRI